MKNPKKFVFIFDKRTFIFPIKDSSNITCQKIMISETDKLNDLLVFIKAFSKFFIILVLYLILWLYIAVFIQCIYQQYGKNIFKICVVPLIFMLFLKMVITVNVMIFISSLILYYKGSDYVNNTKSSFIIKIIFKVLVPPIALNHYSAITSYLAFNRMN